MSNYRFYHHAEDDTQVPVKIGLSVPAFLIPLPWMLYKRLWLHAILYVVGIVGIVIGFGLLTKTFDIPGDFVLLLVFGVRIIPGFLGNRWVEQALIRKGFQLQESVTAASPAEVYKQLGLELAEVYSTSNISDLLFIKSVLDTEEIPYRSTESSMNAAGLLSSPARIYVHHDQKERVVNLLAEVEVAQVET